MADSLSNDNRSEALIESVSAEELFVAPEFHVLSAPLLSLIDAMETKVGANALSSGSWMDVEPLEGAITGANSDSPVDELGLTGLAVNGGEEVEPNGSVDASTVVLGHPEEVAQL